MTATATTIQAGQPAGPAEVDAAAPLLQLRIAPEHRAGIKLNLKTASKMAALVEQWRPA